MANRKSPSGPRVTWQDPVETAADLPADGNAFGDARVVEDVVQIWVWNGSAWQSTTPPPPPPGTQIIAASTSAITDSSAEYALPGGGGPFPANAGLTPLQVVFTKFGTSGNTISWSLCFHNPTGAAIDVTVFVTVNGSGIAGGVTTTVPAGGYAASSGEVEYTGGTPTPTIGLDYNAAAGLMVGGPFAGGTLLARFNEEAP